VALLVEVVRYKPEGRGFDFPCCHWIFHWHNPSGLSMALGSTQPPTEMSTRKFSGGGGGERRPVLRGDKLTTFMCRLY
jgi:hypothetical protein